MRYRVTHSTGYRYSAPASLSQNELLLHPRGSTWQTVENFQLEVVPSPQHQASRIDYFGNRVDLFMVQHPHDSLSITTTSTVATSAPESPPPETTPGWEETAGLLRSMSLSESELDAVRFVFESPFCVNNRDVKDYGSRSFTPGTPILAGALDLMTRIHKEFAYDKEASTVDSTVEHVLATRKGVCQDFAHLAISCLRSLGLAARYVSGYLETLPPPGKPRLVGADASHAWFSVFVPGFGWVDLDPTNNQASGESYITVAWGRDYGDVTPVKGVVMGGGTHQLSVTVDVAPLDRGENPAAPV